jgi:hypothetical protein
MGIITNFSTYLAFIILAFLYLSCEQTEIEEGQKINMQVRLNELASLDTFPTNFTLSDQGVEFYRRLLKNENDVNQQQKLMIALIMNELNSGMLDSGIVHLNTLLDNPDSFFPRDKLYEILGILWQRKGELQNCLSNHSNESCIFPFSEKAVHIERDGSERAIKYYLQALTINPNNHIVKWLLNIAHASLDEYPEKVPIEYFIPLNRYEEYEAKIKFEENAELFGLNSFGLLGGVCVEDFDNDGLQDVFVTSYGLTDNVRYLKNTGNGFVDKTIESGLKGITGGVNVVQADYNNDGHVDIFISRGGWLREAGHHPQSLLRNNGDGTFTDVTFEAGLYFENPSHTACFADVNNDGWLDLFVGVESYNPEREDYSKLFLNNKNGTFTEVAEMSGVKVSGYVKAAIFADFDNDGWQDLFISVYGGGNILFANNTKNNNGKLLFSDISSESGIKEPINSFSINVFDYNNDGLDDILVFGYLIDLEKTNLASEYSNNSFPAVNPPRLYMNLGDMKFKDITQKVGLNRSIYAMGLNFGDLDNDGYTDLYIGTGHPDFRALWPNLLLRNNNGVNFQDITMSSGTGHLQKGHGVAIVDIDNDGRNDIFIQTGGFFSDDKYWDLLFMNKTQSDNNWIKIKVDGGSQNKSAIGTKLELEFTDNGVKRKVFSVVNSGGSYGASSLEKHIGLGTAKSIDKLTIYWASDPKKQEHFNIPSNEKILVNRKGDLQIVPVRKFSLDEHKQEHNKSNSKHMHH